jgi:hypothetical protein
MRFSPLFAILLTVIGKPLADAGVVDADTTKHVILVAHGGSGFEYAVTRELKEHYEGRDTVVRVIDPKQLRGVEREDYAAVVLMSAVDNSRLSREAERIVTRLRRRGSPPNRPVVLVATVRGEEWKEGVTVVDATTRATSKADAFEVANTLIRTLDKRLGDKRDMRPDSSSRDSTN